RMNKWRYLLVSVLAALVAGLTIPAASSAWAPAASATVHPGVQTVTEGAQCTSNFVFQNGSDVYLGQAAHCSGTGEATDTDGCQAGALPIGTAVEVTGASQPGTLAYSSWNSMQAKGTTDASTCAFNDFALVRINPADVAGVNPSVPGYGGPTGLGAPGGLGSTVYSWGNSSLRQGIRQLSPKQGIVLSNDASGWSHNVYTLTPGIPGDSGSGFLNNSGQAFGTLSTLQLAPTVGANGVGDLAKELTWLKANEPAFAGIQLVNGTEPFKPNLVGAILGG
ncbi:MAG TPA: serine protease, partial [Solirubrobacterales bacterium]|nr:serine protease [Solirubrobacterales bacterium]HNE76815.1 serine protease [Solirubrobacterales bacterium]